MKGESAERLFRRMVIGLCAGAGSGEAMRAAAQLAAELGLEVEGLFIEDETLLGLAGLPFLREVRAGTAALHPFDTERLEREMGVAASGQRRALEKAARSTRTGFRFARIRGEIETVVATAAMAGDIVAVLEGGGAGGRTTHAAVSLRRAALRSIASVLYVPAPLRRRPGAVVAVATGAAGEEIMLRTAVRLAARSGNALAVFALDPQRIDRAQLDAWTRQAGLAEGRVAVVRLAGNSTEALSEALDAVEQRLIVLPRGGLGLDDEQALTALATRHRVPILVLEPPAATRQE